MENQELTPEQQNYLQTLGDVADTIVTGFNGDIAKATVALQNINQTCRDAPELMRILTNEENKEAFTELFGVLEDVKNSGLDLNGGIWSLMSNPSAIGILTGLYSAIMKLKLA